MRTSLSANTALAAIAIGLIQAPAFADSVTIGAAQTTPVSTSTANGGSPADINISTSGSITPSAAGAAVTIDSSNSVTNAGAIGTTDISNSVGILTQSGITGAITNSGAITLGESYTQTDGNGDGVVDGAFAQGSGRFGIETAGTFDGAITNSGAITIHGNDSAGIALDGTLNGGLGQTGTITVIGDRSVGISTAAVTGDVGIGGTISATGSGASAVLLNGDIGGTLTVQGALTATGYTSTTLPASTTSLGADNLLQGGPTMQIGGSVAGGVLFAAATSTTDSGGTTTTTGAANITSIGSAPAVQIGAANRAITIGALASDTNGYGLDINGAITANGIYDGIATHALKIGGLGGAVTIAGGSQINGSIAATSNDASATALEIGSGASLPALVTTSAITALGAVKAGDTSTALAIDAGANVPSVTNEGTLSAVSMSNTASSVAFIDSSGTVANFVNSGTITATGGATNVAIDLSADTAGTTVTQQAPSTGTVVPSITGDIRFGSGNDMLAVSDGAITGNVSFGGGSDGMALSNAATFSGAADFGSGTSALSLAGTSMFTGTLANASGLGVAVNGGTLTLTNTGATAIRSLDVENGGTIGIAVDGSTGAASQYLVGGAATFGTGSNIALHFADINHVAGTYDVVQAGSLAGTGNLSISQTALPYLFNASIATNANTVDVVVARKTAAQLGLNRAEAAAYEPVIAAVSGDKPLGDSFLAYGDQASFQRGLRSLLPNFSGDTFDSVSLGSRASMRWLADPDAPVIDAGGVGFWAQEVGWLHNQSAGDAQGYKVSGWGVSGGAEYSLGKIGHVGLSGAFLAGDDKTKDTQNAVTSNQFELGAYWRADWGHLHAFARGSAAKIKFKSTRHFSGSDDGTAVLRSADGSWNGTMYSGSGGLSYRFAFGSFSLRPQASVDYYHLKENGYAETGGGVGMDLLVDTRTSDELAANGTVALGYSIMDDTANDGGYMKVEVEGGRRQLVGGALGATTAQFAGGQSFTLVPDDRTSGWTGALRLKGGNSAFVVSGELDGEREQDTTAVAVRAGLQVSFF